MENTKYENINGNIYKSIHEKKHKRRLSVITDVIIFCILTIFTVIAINKINIKIISDNAGYEEVVSLAADIDIPDISKENETYIDNIKKEYGIVIQYGKDVDNLSKKFNAITQLNENIVNNNLKVIYKTLQKYPKDIFKNNNRYLYVILFDKFENENIALASKNNLNEFKIYLSNTEKLERAFHHEIYHILEYHIEDKHPLIFSSWDNLNPKEFKYNANLANLNKDYVYDSLSSNDFDKIYFITKYSKVSEKEDRAEIFADAMLLSSKTNCFKKVDNINLKINSVLNAIKENITSEELSCYKYIY
jgi:hypothetical protein